MFHNSIFDKAFILNKIIWYLRIQNSNESLINAFIDKSYEQELQIVILFKIKATMVLMRFLNQKQFIIGKLAK